MKYPLELLGSTAWSFGETVSSQEDFILRLIDYNKYLEKDIDPYEIVLEEPKVFIQIVSGDEDGGEDDQYSNGKANDLSNVTFLIESDNGQFFTTVELLYKVHIKISNAVGTTDFKFFEGFELADENVADANQPLYNLILGS